MYSLPQEIISSILIRLPVKSLLRFRCVSKLWCSLIDGPDFIKLHLTHSITTRSNLSPIAQSGSEGTLYNLDSNSFQDLVKIETPFINPIGIGVCSSCNGLLLLRNNFSRSFILFNPSTRKHIFLPTPPESKYVDVGYVQQTDCLGYDVINDDYKVFNFLELFEKGHKFITCETKIYNLKSNSWCFVKDFTKGKKFHCVSDAYVNGALHTVNYENTRTIVALDIEKEVFNSILMPNFEDNNVGLFMAHVFDGCLAVLCLYRDHRTDIWVMREYGVKESWTMLLSVKPENFDRIVIPMVYSKCCTEVLLSYDSWHAVWYDLKKKTVRGFEVSGFPIKVGPTVCLESLVSVNGFGEIDEKKKQYGDEK